MSRTLQLHLRLEELSRLAMGLGAQAVIRYATVKPLAKRVELAEKLVTASRELIIGCLICIFSAVAWLISLYLANEGLITVALWFALAATPALAFGFLMATSLGRYQQIERALKPVYPKAEENLANESGPNASTD